MNYQYFEKLWLNKLQADIYLVLLKTWNQPASVVAKRMWVERTKVYRYLLQLVKLWIVKKSKKHNSQTFFIDDVQDLKKITRSKSKELEYLEENEDKVISLIEKSQSTNLNLPKITLYEAWEWVGNIFEDILNNIKKQNLLTVRIFASNTIHEKDVWWTVWEYASNFFRTLEKEWIHLEEYLWVWNQIMERIEYYMDSKNFPELPAANSSINIILVWNIVYFVIYNEAPIWVKIENENLADALHIMMDEILRLKEMLEKK